MSRDPDDPTSDAYERAGEAFRAAMMSSDDPAAHFSIAMRAACEGFEAGVISVEARISLASHMLCAEQALARAVVPKLLSAEAFETMAARLSELLTLWTLPHERRAGWHPDYAVGFRAMIRILANEIENISLSEIAIRGAPTSHELAAQRAVSRQALDHTEVFNAPHPHSHTRH
ncbi:hypothetical protein [Methylobacterium trifolii]|uniref:DUF222 domain-containing protein n=1 Tax=Methylobacterium trifolii TaxID=1003092 RepID=A0ABQ4U0H0_9HYPH|nr:hypothetical protein [Methylobacterium trifolii]GJE60276.1 hypothetical protein MPOCJGCO_2387 [Methylobacterium trifolii]